jgi:hypothetical protein
MVSQGVFKLRRDNANRTSFHTVWGEQIVVERTADVEEQFQYNVNTKTLTTTTVGNGAASQENSMMKISTGTTTTGSVAVESVSVIRYRPGFEAYALFTAIWDNGGVADSIQHIGPFTTNDGYFVGYTGTEFVVGMKFDGTIVTQDQTKWSGDKYFESHFDPTKLNIFRISYGWLGAAPITFEYSGDDGLWHIMHQMVHANTLAKPTTSNPQLPICIRATKTDGATDIVMHTASWGGGINGTDSGAGDRYFTKAAAATVSTEAVILNLQSVETFQSKTNRVVSKLVKASMSSDGTKNVKIKIYAGLVISGASWTDIDATNSTIQFDTSGTVTPDDDNLIMEYDLAKVDSIVDAVGDISANLPPNTTITITGTSASNNDVSFTVRWRELF